MNAVSSPSEWKWNASSKGSDRRGCENERVVGQKLRNGQRDAIELSEGRAWLARAVGVEREDSVAVDDFGADVVLDVRQVGRRGRRI